MTEKIATIFRKQRRGIILLILLVMVYFFVFSYYNFVPPGNLSKWNKGNNGIWLGSCWLRSTDEPLDKSEMDEKLTLFKQMGIKYLFPHLCPMDSAGNLPKIDQARFTMLREQVTGFGDQFMIMPWVGGSTNTVSLFDDKQMHNWCKQVADLVSQYDLPGVNVNIEPLEHGNKQVYIWLDTLRTYLGKDKLISFCGIRPESQVEPAELCIWTVEDYRELALHVDLITIMGYDTGRSTPIQFVYWTSKQLPAILKAVAESSSGKCSVLWGVPTYEDKADYFDPEVENLRTALHGVGDGLESVEEPSSFAGLCVYADWTTDATEWNEYEKCWISE